MEPSYLLITTIVLVLIKITIIIRFEVINIVKEVIFVSKASVYKAIITIFILIEVLEKIIQKQQN